MRCEDVLNELRYLIQVSCNFTAKPTPEIQNFHKEFLKKSLGAWDISIDYKNKTITSWSGKPVSIDASTVYKLRDSVNPNILYDDLEATLMGCIQYNPKFQALYAKLIEKYETALTNSFPRV